MLGRQVPGDGVDCAYMMTRTSPHIASPERPMKLQLFGKMTTFNQVEQGALFHFAASNTEYLAMKCWTPSRQAILLLRPGAPSYDGQPGIISGALSAEDHVLELSDVEIRRSLEPNHTRLANTAMCDVGDLVLSPGRTCLLVRHGPGTAHVDVVTGEVVNIESAPAVVKVWSIVHLRDRKPIVLLRHPSDVA